MPLELPKVRPHRRSSLHVEAVPQLSIIVPVYNECQTIDQVIDRLGRLSFTREIIIVDDGSDDGTVARVKSLAERPDVFALYHDRNWGKGAAIRTAIHHVRGEVVVIQDADLEYDPAEIERLVAPIVQGQADVTLGSRFAGSRKSSCPRFRRLANSFLTWLSNRFSGLALTDMETCYKAMSREVAQSITVRENRFGIEPELVAKIARGKWRVIEVPISYQAREIDAGKKIRFRDGLRAIWCIVRYSRWD